MHMLNGLGRWSIVITIVAFTTACAPQSRHGMVIDPQDGYQYGSAVENNLLVDASQFSNQRIKVTLRNTSGDMAYDIKALRHNLEAALAAKGYEPVDSDYGIRFDVNVLYSGHIQENLAGQYAFLGGAAGGIVGHRGGASAGTAIGILGGGVLGALIGSNVTEDTYITITEMSLAISDSQRGQARRTLVLGSSAPLEEKRPTGVRPFQEIIQNKVAVYAGGRNASQAQISTGVRQRLARILADII